MPTGPTPPSHGESPPDPAVEAGHHAADADENRVLTWAALLGRWTDFARSALALPETGDAGRVRQSVVSIITLQAITHALGEVDLLDAAERAVALDRAEILVKQHAGEIHSVWRGETLPEEIRLLVHDARQMLRFTRSLGVEWRLMEDRFVARHPGELVMALTTMVEFGPRDLYLPSPGATLFESSPVAFARFEGGEGAEAGLFGIIESFLGVALERETGVIPRQVYRQFDFGAGGPVRDVVMPMEIEQGASQTLPAGQPLLVPAVLDGQPQAVPLPPRSATGAEMKRLPVVFEA
jgi:hypothetical protein